MSTTTTTEAPEAATDDAQQTAEPQSHDEPLGEGGKRALEAERQANKVAKQKIADLESQVAAFQSEKMTELEKAQAAATAATKRAEQAEIRALRAEIATEHGISKADADLFLTGSDTESLTRQAVALAEKNSVAPRTPLPDPSQGRGSDQLPDDRRTFLREMFGD